MTIDRDYVQGSTFPEPVSEDRPEDREQKETYRRRLAEALKDPEFRKIEGFPLGTDEAILNLSDPPYYTACPNPFLPEILEQWRAERRETRKELGLADDEALPAGVRGYHREPFAADVSEGKNDPIYNAHSYHTKVPHKAIMRYILHYTDPGDIVFDGFCGSGMTGVAAQLCCDRKTVESLGYTIDKKGTIYEGEKAISKLGARKAVLNDLSPAATFIAYNYNAPINVDQFEHAAQHVMQQIENECGWMYETYHPNCDAPNRIKARINYVVWSEIKTCPSCSHELVFHEIAFDHEKGHVKDEFICPHCDVKLISDDLEMLVDKYYDNVAREITNHPRRVPVLINYQVGKQKFEKNPDSFDLNTLKKIEDLPIPPEVPYLKLPDMQMARVGRMKTTGVNYIHHFFLPRQAHSLAVLWREVNRCSNDRLRNFLQFFIEQAIWGMSVLNRYQPIQHGKLGGSQVNRALSGVFYVASQISEVSPWYNLNGKLKRMAKIFRYHAKDKTQWFVTTEDLGSLTLPINSCDYIFTDPPFGENIYYSDLNLLVESWHKVITAPEKETIVDRARGKHLQEYEQGMLSCFIAYYQALKPRRWITIEFHNSLNSVWNAIQQALQQAGFVIADVRTLDKQQGSFQQVNSSTAVKQDLVISAYKPTTEFERKFATEGGSAGAAWEFVRQHLEQLPMPGLSNEHIEVQGERMPYLLYDRMVAFHLVRGLTMPLSSSDFYQGLSQRWLARDGMYFTAPQAAQYDRLRLKADSVQQLALFITDEASAILWLRGELDEQGGHGRQTYAEIQPKFVKQWHPEKYEKLPELLEILKQNFLRDEEERWYVPDPDNAAHLEAMRQRDLLREFTEYTAGSGRIKVFRAEAVKAGFSKAWSEHRYLDIVRVADRLPDQALQEDPQLKLYCDNARSRAPKEPKQERII